MAESSGSRGRWDAGKIAKKPRKEDTDDPFVAVSPPTATTSPPSTRQLPLEPVPLLPNLASDVPPPSVPPPQPQSTNVQGLYYIPLFHSAHRPPSLPTFLSSFSTEAARAFNQLRVRAAPETTSPSISGADQPPSPKKRKAAVSLSLLREDSVIAATTQDDNDNDKNDNNDNADTNKAEQEEESNQAVPSGPVSELLHVFGRIQLNKDFYDAIDRTESCAGRMPRGNDTAPTRADVDRAAFEAAVGAASAMLRTQVHALAQEGRTASPAFLQAYALNAISHFATRTESSYSGEDVSGIEEYTPSQSFAHDGDRGGGGGSSMGGGGPRQRPG